MKDEQQDCLRYCQAALETQKAAILRIIEGMRIYDQEDTSMSNSAKHGYNAALADVATRIKEL